MENFEMVRRHARNIGALDGVDTKQLEAALTVAEQERGDARGVRDTYLECLRLSIQNSEKMKAVLTELLRAIDIMHCNCAGGFAERGLIAPDCHKHQFDADPETIGMARKFLETSKGETDGQDLHGGIYGGQGKRAP